MIDDPCSKVGAQGIAQSIEAYWKRRGYHEIKTRIERVKMPSRYGVPEFNRSLREIIYAVKTNIGPNGYPPGIAGSAA